MNSMIKQKTIAAIVTPLGEGGIGKIIVSGPEAITIISSIFRWKKTKDIRNGQDWKLYYGYIVESGQRIDEVIVNIIKQRSSDTGEDTVEVNCHGGIRILRRVYELIIQMGAKKTGWDSLLQQSFENKKTDLIRKEAHRAIIDVKTKLGAKILLDQYAGALSKALWKGLKMIDEIKMSRLKGAESFQASVYSALSEHIETLLKTAPLGMALTDPLTIVILGKPNTGKSTIINTLIGAEYMIVHHEPGTTRDYVSEFISVEDIPFEIIDTAGMRDTEDELESMSIEMTREQLNQADRVILMFDNSRPFEQEDKMIINAVKVWSHAKNAKSYNKKYGTNNIFPVINKRDLPDKQRSIGR